MKLLDTLLGRTQRKPANLDALFALPAAAITLETEAGLHPAGRAAVSYKPASGQAFAQAQADAAELLRLSAEQSGSTLHEEDDTYGYHWVVVGDPDLEDLTMSVHMVNSTLEDRGLGSQLLCSLFAFESFGGGPRVYLVYLYKRGTFYPFAPRAGERRDTELELRLRSQLATDLPIEPDLERWFPLWRVPA